MTNRIFAHSTPELYDRYMGPLLFEPYAKLVAGRCAVLEPDSILETAAGTGIVTRAVHRAVPRAHVVATDINPAMLEHATHALRSEHVSFQPADFVPVTRAGHVSLAGTLFAESGGATSMDPVLAEWSVNLP